jgi:hypothetical protein
MVPTVAGLPAARSFRPKSFRLFDVVPELIRRLGSEHRHQIAAYSHFRGVTIATAIGMNLTDDSRD